MSAMEKLPLLAHTFDSFSIEILKRLGKGAYHAGLIYKEWIQKGQLLCHDPAFNNAGRLKEEILALTDFTLPKLVNQLEDNQTGKFLLETVDHLQIESVLLPKKAGWTLCISSQIGCAMGCSFCQTGKMGLLRNLRPEEIVSQIFVAKHVMKYPVRNIVFMGMGEPLDNFEAVMQAIQVLKDPCGFNLGASHITLSTSGLVEKIKLLIENDLGIHLAVSVNASGDEMRGKLMPINCKHNMQELKDAMLLYCKHLQRKIFIEYVLIEGKNDSLKDASALALYLKDLDVTVNLIPYNPQRRGVFKAPQPEVVDSFAAFLRTSGYLTFVRQTMGQSIMAACGQLGNSFLFSRRDSKINNVSLAKEVYGPPC